MRYSLRTLLIIMLLAGPLGAWGWKEWQAYRARRSMEATIELARLRAKALRRNTNIAFPPATQTTATADEIWEQQRDRITWESFPESQPPRP